MADWIGREKMRKLKDDSRLHIGSRMNSDAAYHNESASNDSLGGTKKTELCL